MLITPVVVTQLTFPDSKPGFKSNCAPGGGVGVGDGFGVGVGVGPGGGVVASTIEAAGVSALLAVRAFTAFVARSTMEPFAWYRLGLAAAVVAVTLLVAR